MALGTPTALDAVESTAGVTSLATASLSPTAGAIVIVVATTLMTDAEDGDPTISGLGATWTQATEVVALGDRAMRVWWAGEASYTTGAVTITAAGTDTMDLVMLSVLEISGADLTGPVQVAAAATGNTSAAPNTVSSSFGVATDAANTVITLASGIAGAYDASPATGFTELAGCLSQLSGESAQEVHYASASSETAASVSWNNGATSLRYFIAGLEIAAAGGSGGPRGGVIPEGMERDGASGLIIPNNTRRLIVPVAQLPESMRRAA